MNLVPVVLATLLAFDAAPTQSIVVSGMSFGMVVHQRSFKDCDDAAAQLSGKEIAVAHTFYHYGAVPDPSDPDLRLLVVAVDTEKSYVEIPRISWPYMSSAEIQATDRLYDELVIHERGHLAIAVSSAAEVTALKHTVPAGVDPRAALTPFAALLDARQREYDAVTAHGVRQSRAPANLRGDDIRLVCREGER